MKIAIVSDHEQTISRHFGHAENYVVISVEQGQITDRKTLPKQGHPNFATHQSGKHGQKHRTQDSGFGHHANCKHELMIEDIRDCEILLTGGMGRGAYLDLQKLGIEPIITDIPDIETAVQALLDGTIVNHLEALH